MQDLIAVFAVCFIASLCADFIAIAVVAWGNDEIQHLERKLDDTGRDF